MNNKRNKQTKRNYLEFMRLNPDFGREQIRSKRESRKYRTCTK